MAVFAAFADGVPPAEARRESFAAEPWTGWAYCDDGGRFLHCAITRLYDDGVRLILSLTAEGALTVNLLGRDWQLRPGGRYRVGLALDDKWRQELIAEAPRERLLMIRLPDGTDIVGHLRRAYALTVDDGFERRAFDLKGTSKALPRLQACVRERARQAIP